ncbi:MAG: hypothetical protein ACYTBP_12330 [Planctomycetota bacterium]|jgi:UDP-glucose 6-dehydrogenase
MRLTIVGLGYVGHPIVVCLSDGGNSVLGFASESGKIALLKKA